MHIKLIAVNGRFTHSSLALFHVRNELEAHCPEINVEIVQLTIRDPSYEVLLEISKGSPDAVFFTSAVWNSDRVEDLMADLHGLDPSCMLVVGGPQAEVVGRNLGNAFCTVVTGAVEAVGDEFYDDLIRDNLRPEYGGSFFHLTDKRFVSPYRDEDFSTHLKNRNIYYESSRGCPFSCTYCLSSAEKGMVHKDLGQVQQEIDRIMAHHPAILRFVDRTFNDLPDRALAIWKMLLEYDSETLFHFEIAPDRFSEEMFSFLFAVPPGRFQFEIGIQSTHLPTLAAISRKINPVTAGETVRRLASFANIHLHVDLILGLPFETEASYLHSFADVFGMGSQYIQMGLLKILPHTAISRGAEQYGYRSCRRPPYSVLSSQWLSAPVLQHLYWFSECVELFCNNRYFPSIWQYLRRCEEDIASFFTELTLVARKSRLFQLAATQKLLVTILSSTVAKRKDRDLLQQLMIHDWLRCGQWVLPECLAEEGAEGAKQLKDQLYRSLPGSLDGLYNKKNRNRFFKQSVFYSFSAECLQELGFPCEERAILVFLRMREKGLLRLQEAALLPAARLLE